MVDLFAALESFETLRLRNAEVSYLRQTDVGIPPEILLEALIKQTPWRQEYVTIWGKTFLQPRLVAWYGDPKRVYRYSGITMSPLPWTKRIEDIKRRIESVSKHHFNSVLLNYYRDQDDSMGLHSDDEKELGPRPVIASLSLGVERTFVFKSKEYPDEKPTRLKLASGSLLLMKGDTQKNYKHGLSKETRLLGPRVNLTFRTIFS